MDEDADEDGGAAVGDLFLSYWSAAQPKKPYAIESSESASDEAKSARPAPPKTSVRTKAPAVTMPRTTLSIPVSITLRMTKREYSLAAS